MCALKTAFTTVRVCKRSTKPVSLLCKGNETETETEDCSGFSLPFVWVSRWNQISNGRVTKFPPPKKPSPLADHDDGLKEDSNLEIDMKNSSPMFTLRL